MSILEKPTVQVDGFYCLHGKRFCTFLNYTTSYYYLYNTLKCLIKNCTATQLLWCAIVIVSMRHSFPSSPTTATLLALLIIIAVVDIPFILMENYIGVDYNNTRTSSTSSESQDNAANNNAAQEAIEMNEIRSYNPEIQAVTNNLSTGDNPASADNNNNNNDNNNTAQDQAECPGANPDIRNRAEKWHRIFNVFYAIIALLPALFFSSQHSLWLSDVTGPIIMLCYSLSLYVTISFMLYFNSMRFVGICQPYFLGVVISRVIERIVLSIIRPNVRLFQYVIPNEARPKTHFYFV